MASSSSLTCSDRAHKTPRMTAHMAMLLGAWHDETQFSGTRARGHLRIRLWRKLFKSRSDTHCGAQGTLLQAKDLVSTG